MVYNVADSQLVLAHSLHELPHVNFSLHDIPSKNANFTDPQYIQSLEVYVLTGLFLGFSLFITFGLLQCCIGCRYCMRGSLNYSYRMRQYNPLLTFFLSLCTVLVMITMSLSLYYGTVAVEEDINKIAGYITDVSQTVDEYNSLILDIRAKVITLQNYSSSSPISGLIQGKLEDVVRELDRDTLNTFNDTIQQLIKYNRIRELATIGLILVQVFSCATLLIGICYGRVFILHWCLVVLSFCMFFLSATCGAYLSGAVAAADICIEQTAFINYIIDVEQVSEHVLKLFIKCQDPSTAAFRHLDMLNMALSFLGNHFGVPPEIKDTINSITLEVGRLEHLLGCQELIKDSKAILAVLCNPFLSHMVKYCVITLVSVFAVWLVINQLKPYSDRLQEWFKVEGILDKNITMTPEGEEETDNLISDNSYTPPAYPTYGAVHPGYGHEAVLNTDPLEHHSTPLYTDHASFYKYKSFFRTNNPPAIRTRS